MTGNASLRFRPGDLLAIGAVLVCALALGLGLWVQAAAVERVEVRVYQEGELLQALPLDRDHSFTLAGTYTNTITIQDGRVAVTHTDCPGADCAHSGWISAAGRAIVCLPNRVEIRLTGMPDVDAVAG